MLLFAASIDTGMQGENELIIQDLISGSDKAFAEVYRKYHAQAYTYLLRRTASVTMAEELLQLSFIKLIKNTGTFYLRAVARKIARQPFQI